MPVSVRLGASLEEQLTRASRKLRLNKTEIIKRSVEAYLAQVEPGRTPFDLGRDLFGADQGRETTLSSGVKRRLTKKLRAKHHR